MTDDKRNPFLTYLWRWVATMAALLGIVAALNVVADPYGAYSAISPAGLDAYKPGAGGRIGKAELAARRPWEAIILGSSRALCGVDPADEAWGGRQVVNLGLAGTRMEEVLAVFRFTVARALLKQVLLLTEFHAFNARAKQFGDDFAHSRFNPDLNWVDYHGGNLLSWRAAEASWRAIRRWSAGRVNDYGPLGFGTPHRLAEMGFRRSLQRVMARRHRERHQPPAYEISAEAVAALAEILQTCADRKIDLRMTIPPCHALEMELVRADRHWPTLEEWKRRLVRIVADHNGRTGREVRLWDFTGYHGPLGETVPPADAEQIEMKWHYDPGHFKPALGDRMLKAVLADPPTEDGDGDGLGVILTPDNVERHLERIRRDRAAYVAGHEEDAALVRGQAP